VSLKEALFGLIILIVPIAPVVLLAGAFYTYYAMNACITEVTRDDIVRSNMRFQIMETDCSTLGEDASVSVYGFNQAGGEKTLLFKYDPRIV
jgi:hypothetical protein